MYLIKKETSLAKMLEAACDVYHQRVNAAQRGHGLGPPCIHIAAALLKNEHLNPEVRNPVAQMSSQLSQMTHKQVAMRIRQCRLAMCHDDESWKLQVAIVLPEWLFSLSESMAKDGCEVKEEIAPMFWAERNLRR